jgi:hypothetical protein
MMCIFDYIEGNLSLFPSFLPIILFFLFVKDLCHKKSSVMSLIQTPAPNQHIPLIAIFAQTDQNVVRTCVSWTQALGYQKQLA